MKTDRKKILVVENAHAPTGAFKSIFALSNQLREKFHFTFCLHSKSSLIKYLSERNIDFVSLPFLEVSKGISLLFYFPVLLYNSLRLAVITSSKKIDIIHVNDLYNMTGIIHKILKPRVKVIYHVRLLRSSYAKLLYPVWVKLLLKYADEIVCNSFAVKNGLQTSSSKVRVIYNLPPVWSAPPASKEFANEPLTLLYLANFIPGKGQNFAIEAFAKAKREMPGLSLKMIMAGGSLGKKSNEKFKQQLTARVRDLNLESSILFTDFTSDVEGSMKKASIFLNFSESESFSMTCLEALSLGTPVIATDCGGPAELIENEKTGLLVKNRHVDAMAEAIVRLCRNPELQASFVKNGLALVRSKFAVSEITKEYISLYENAHNPKYHGLQSPLNLY